MDRVILGQGCYLEDELGSARPNDNQVLVGASGSGKSLSGLLPTLLNQKERSLLTLYSKEGEARKLEVFLRAEGFETQIFDLVHPEKSDGFDPLHYVRNYDDIRGQANQIVQATLGVTKDEYWNQGAIDLLGGFEAAVKMTKKDGTFADVLELLDQCDVIEKRDGFFTPLDDFFDQMKELAPRSYATRAFTSWRSLPYRTASCIRNTLATALSATFPESIRPLMRRKSMVDFRRLANRRMALIIISSPVNTSLHYFANLMMFHGIKDLLEYSEECPHQRLPRPVKLAFDDFACSAPIRDFPQHISIFRAAGISAMLCLQSESQLRSLYGEEQATTILNNCSAYAYFPGGMDLTTCRNVSIRFDLPLADVLYAPVGNVFVMRSGEKPVIVPRYDTLNSPEYQRYLQAQEQDPERKPVPRQRRKNIR